MSSTGLGLPGSTRLNKAFIELYGLLGSTLMMVVVDIPGRLIDEVRDAVERGEFDGACEFVTVALPKLGRTRTTGR